jgi:hypothetical protein
VRLLIAVGAIAVLVLVVRLVADPMATRYVRKILDRHDDTSAHFRGVHMTFFPPGGRIDRLKVVESVDVELKAPLFYAERVSVVLSWSSLLRGKPIGRVVVESPKITLLHSSARRNSPREFQQLLPRSPIRIESVEVTDGEMLIPVGKGKNATKVWLHHLRGTIARQRSDTDVFAGEATGILQKTGKLKLDLTVDTGASTPTFSVQAGLRSLEILDMSALLAAKSGLKATSGEIAMRADIECGKGILSGTVKTEIENPVLRPVGGGVTGDIKAALMAAGVAVRAEKENGDRTLTTVVPFRGKMGDSVGEQLTALLDSIRDSFEKGMMHGFDSGK